MARRSDMHATPDRRHGLNRRQVLAGAGLVGLGAVLGPRGLSAQEEAGGTLIEGSSLIIESLAPIVDANRHTQFLFDTLVSTNAETLQPMPNLAERWEIAPDGLTYTFTLKSGVTFHDGEPLTADDVKFTFDLLLNPATASAYLSIFDERIAAVEAPDPTTVVFTMKRPVATFLTDLSAYSIGILPQHLLASVAPEEFKASEFSQSAPVGSGPFRFKEYLPGEALTLEANPDYHRGAPAIGQYVLKLLKDPTAAYQQLKTGEVDVAPIGADFYEDATSQSNFTPVTMDTFGMDILGFNLDPAKGSPALQDVAVRQALCYAVDRQLIVDRVLSGLGTVAIGTEPPVTWAHQPEQMTLTYDYDPDQAAALLDEAGWTAGDDGVREKDGQKLAFSALGVTGNKTDEGILLAIQEFLGEVGVEMTPKFEEASAAWDLRLAGDFEATLVNYTYAPDPDQSLAWASDSAYNLWRYNNPTVDDLLKRGLETLDVEARTAIYVEMQNALLTDMPAFVMHFTKRITGVNNRVQNYTPSAVGYYWAVHYDAPTWTVADG